MVNAICLAFGIVFLVAFIIPTARKLQSTCQFDNDSTVSLTVVIRTSDAGLASEDAVDTRIQQRPLDSFTNVMSVAVKLTLKIIYPRCVKYFPWMTGAGTHYFHIFRETSSFDISTNPLLNRIHHTIAL